MGIWPREGFVRLDGRIQLACTELVYRACQGKIRLDPVRGMGRDTLPAFEMLEKFARERGWSDRDLDFVVLLDGIPPDGRAAFSRRRSSADPPTAPCVPRLSGALPADHSFTRSQTRRYLTISSPASGRKTQRRSVASSG